MLHGDTVSAFGAFHHAAQPTVCALTRISDLRIARELVLTTQKEVGRNNAGTIQHCKVMILDVGVYRPRMMAVSDVVFGVSL